MTLHAIRFDPYRCGVEHGGTAVGGDDVDDAFLLAWASLVLRHQGQFIRVGLIRGQSETLWKLKRLSVQSWKSAAMRETAGAGISLS